MLKYMISDTRVIARKLFEIVEDVAYDVLRSVDKSKKTKIVYPDKEDAMETASLVKEVGYDNAFTFIYSPREGTPAAKMEDNIDLKTKEDRLHRLNEIVNKYSNMNNQTYLDKTVPVLITGVSEKDENKLCGYTDTFKLVNVEGGKRLIGEIVNVKITDAKSFSLDGKVE